jgi:hypothetical protein
MRDIRNAWGVVSQQGESQSLSYMDHEPLLFLDEALNIVYKHQHPDTCDNQSYLLSQGYNSGFGSEIHVEGYGLAVAMEVGRVYLSSSRVDPRRAWQSPESLCYNHTTSKPMNALRCYYETWSNCSCESSDWLTRIVHANSETLLSDARVSNNSNDRLVKIQLTSHPVHRLLIPRQLKHLTDLLPVPDQNKYYWWRAVSAAYLSRLNNMSKTMLAANRIPRHQHNSSKCVAMYVRHGDKGSEMMLHGFDEYASAAQSLWADRVRLGHFKSDDKPTIILGTETPHILVEAVHWGRKHGWNIVYNKIVLDIFREKGVDLAKHLSHPSLRGIFNQSVEMDQSKHIPMEYFSMIANLADLMQCDMFVCTLASNYCRMLDELRVAIGDRASSPFVDLSPETCSDPPCGLAFGEEELKSFSW